MLIISSERIFDGIQGQIIFTIISENTVMSSLCQLTLLQKADSHTINSTTTNTAIDQLHNLLLLSVSRAQCSERSWNCAKNKSLLKEQHPSIVSTKGNCISEALNDTTKSYSSLWPLKEYTHFFLEQFGFWSTRHSSGSLCFICCAVEEAVISS